MLLVMVKLWHPGSLDHGETTQLYAHGQPVLPLSLRWPDQSGGFGQFLPPCSSRLGESETCQAGLVKILSCKFMLLAPISSRRGSLRTEAPGGPRLAKGPCEYSVTAGRALPGAGRTGAVGVLTLGPGDPAQASEQEAREAEGRKQKAWETGGGRQGQAGWPAFTCERYGPRDQVRRRRAQGFPGQNFRGSKSKVWHGRPNLCRRLQGLGIGWCPRPLIA